MNIVQLNNFIEKIVSCTEIVKSFYTDSVYECWNAEEVKYGSISFCITKTQMRERTMTYTAMIYYGDRLMEDKSNRNAIWSDASQVIQSIIGTVNGLDGEITISYPYDLTLFEQKFADELAGAYAEIDIEVEGIGECGDLLYGYENSEEIKLESVVKVFTVNGEYDIIPSDGFDAISDVKVVVDVPLQMGVYGLRSNGRSVIEPDPGYEGFKTVEVDVEVPIQSKSVEFNSNGVYDVVPDSEYAAMDNVEVNVNIPLQSKSVVYSEVGDYEVVPDPGYEALSKVDVKVSLEGKTKIPNGFRFGVGDSGIGDLDLIEWDKYDWSMVYDANRLLFNAVPKDDGWFERFKNGFNGNLIGMREMLYNLQWKGVLDFEGLDTSNVVDMKGLFYGAWITGVRNLDTSNVVNMNSMFGICTNTEIPQMDTSNVTDMSIMFTDCKNITTIPQMDTSKVVNMSGMFRYCSSLTTIPQLNTSNVTNMSDMFNDCSNLTTIPQLDTSNVDVMYNMFYRCSKLITIPQLDTSNVTNMSSMFYYCSNLTTIPQLDISKVSSMSGMFQNCINLTSVKFKGEPVSTLNVNSMFSSVKSNGTLYYDSRYDYSKIINVLPSTWTAVPYDVLN